MGCLPAALSHLCVATADLWVPRWVSGHELRMWAVGALLHPAWYRPGDLGAAQPLCPALGATRPLHPAWGPLGDA